jgi:hypothetical protein
MVVIECVLPCGHNSVTGCTYCCPSTQNSRPGGSVYILTLLTVCAGKAAANIKGKTINANLTRAFFKIIDFPASEAALSFMRTSEGQYT